MKQEILYLSRLLLQPAIRQNLEYVSRPFERVKYWVLRVSAKAVPLYWRMYQWRMPGFGHDLSGWRSGQLPFENEARKLGIYDLPIRLP